MRDRRLPVGERQLEIVDRARRGIEDAELLVGIAMQDHQLAVVEYAVVPEPEQPQRAGELLVAWRQRFGAVAPRTSTT